MYRQRVKVLPIQRAKRLGPENRRQIMSNDDT
ncbi:MAG: hypothetical protein RLZ98_3434, partial [Pseudomonadota bacterium]